MKRNVGLVVWDPQCSIMEYKIISWNPILYYRTTAVRLGHWNQL